MIGTLLWLIYLLTYSDTKLALLGSRSNFDRNLYVFKDYGAKILRPTEEFSNKG